MQIEATIEEGERFLARTWRSIAFKGVLAIAVGIVLLAWPGIGLKTLLALFGAFAFVSGFATVVAAFKLPIAGGRRAWLAVDGLVGVVVGVLVFAWPGMSALAVLYVIAAFAIAAGVVELAAAFMLPVSGRRSLLLVLGAVLSVAFGIIMFAHPGAGALALLSLIAAFAIVSGVTAIAYALELRSIAAEAKHRFRLRATTRPIA